MIEIIGKYKVLRLLGEGAMGAVYLAEDPDIGRQVAIKVMKAEAAEDHERFRQEARIVGGLSHPNIVVLHDFGFHEGRPYLVMQFLPGASLEDWLRSPHELPEHLRVMEGLVSALDYAHGRGVLHRDLKPSNVQVTPEGDGRLMDFGIARVPEAKLTATGTVMGTPAYMAPEILGDAQYSTRADHYSAALVLYEMLSGGNPFLGQTISSTLTNVLTREPSDLASLRSDVPRELCAAIMAHLAKDPRKRPPDLAALLGVLRTLRSAARPQTGSAGEAQRPGAGSTQSIQDLRGVWPGAPVRSETEPSVPGPGAQAHTSPPRPRAWIGALAVVAVAAVVWVATRSAIAPAVGPSPLVSPPSRTPPLVTPSPPAASEATETAAPAAAPQSTAPATVPTTQAAVTRRSTRPSPPPTTLAPVEARPAEVSPTPPPLAPATPPPTTTPPASVQATPVPAPPPTTPPAAAPSMPTLTDLSPSTCRRGNVATFDLRGTDFRSEHKVRILRGGHEVPGLRVTRQSLSAPGRMRITLFVGADVPLGSYSVVLAEPSGALSDAVSFEVVL